MTELEMTTQGGFEVEKKSTEETQSKKEEVLAKARAARKANKIKEENELKEIEENLNPEEALLMEEIKIKKQTKVMTGFKVENEKIKDKSQFEVLKEAILEMTEGRAVVEFNQKENFATFKFTKITKQGADGRLNKTPVTKDITLNGVSLRDLPALVERVIDL